MNFLPQNVPPDPKHITPPKPLPTMTLHFSDPSITREAPPLPANTGVVASWKSAITQTGGVVKLLLIKYQKSILATTFGLFFACDMYSRTTPPTFAPFLFICCFGGYFAAQVPYIAIPAYLVYRSSFKA